jgi:hypothetical protein
MSRRQGIRLSRTIGKSSDVIEKTAVGLFRWAATDHSGMSKVLDNMPPMGFIDTINFILMHLLITVVGAFMTGIMVFLLVAYGTRRPISSGKALFDVSPNHSPGGSPALQAGPTDSLQSSQTGTAKKPLRLRANLRMERSRLSLFSLAAPITNHNNTC